MWGAGVNTEVSTRVCIPRQPFRSDSRLHWLRHTCLQLPLWMLQAFLRRCRSNKDRRVRPYMFFHLPPQKPELCCTRKQKNSGTFLALFSRGPLRTHSAMQGFMGLAPPQQTLPSLRGTLTTFYSSWAAALAGSYPSWVQTTCWLHK